MTQNTPKSQEPSLEDWRTLTWPQLKAKYPHIPSDPANSERVPPPIPPEGLQSPQLAELGLRYPKPAGGRAVPLDRDPQSWILTQEQARAMREDRVMNAMIRALEIQRQRQKMQEGQQRHQLNMILVAIPFLMLAIHLLSLLLRRT